MGEHQLVPNTTNLPSHKMRPLGQFPSFPLPVIENKLGDEDRGLSTNSMKVVGSRNRGFRCPALDQSGEIAQQLIGRGKPVET
jgi:hypothetical protein